MRWCSMPLVPKAPDAPAVVLDAPPHSSPAPGAGPRRVLYVAIVGDIAIAVAKFFVAAVTGSSAMLTEGVHSLVDTGNELLLLYGVRRSRRVVDEWHPFGYG